VKQPSPTSTLQKLAAEAFGAFALVFAGTGAIVINDVSGGAVTHVGVALTFGLVVLAMIYALGEISGAHLNPAVTLGFVVARRFPLSAAPGYILCQCLGAIAASLTLRLLFRDHPTLGATLPHGPAMQSFILEGILALMLMVVILNVSGQFAGVAIGAVIALEALFAGPISGASMNPARSLAPAIISGKLDFLWVYLTAPFAGALLGVAIGAIIGGTNERRRATHIA
jgi:MIP family channel proteins